MLTESSAPGVNVTPEDGEPRRRSSATTVTRNVALLPREDDDRSDEPTSSRSSAGGVTRHRFLTRFTPTASSS
jgi:hypothetical protein